MNNSKFDMYSDDALDLLAKVKGAGSCEEVWLE